MRNGIIVNGYKVLIGNRGEISVVDAAGYEHYVTFQRIPMRKKFRNALRAVHGARRNDDMCHALYGRCINRFECPSEMEPLPEARNYSVR